MQLQKDDGSPAETDKNAAFGEIHLMVMAELCQTAMQSLQGGHAHRPIALHLQQA
jgi:hypothetical protein